MPATVRERLREPASDPGDSEPTRDDGQVGAEPTVVQRPHAGKREVVDGKTATERTASGGRARRAVQVGEAVHAHLQNPRVERAGVSGRVVRSGEPRRRARRGREILDGDHERDHGALRGRATAPRTREDRRINGAIAELGTRTCADVANSFEEGTLLLRSGQEEGVVCFQRGLLRLAKVGSQRGVKALVRMFAWRDGSFEFHARLEDDLELKDVPLPLEAALLDAMRQMDEGTLVDVNHFPLQAQVVMCEDVDVASFEEPSKVEAAILDLARAGFSIQRMLDVIPEPDPEIFRALQSLREAGLIEIRT